MESGASVSYADIDEKVPPLATGGLASPLYPQPGAVRHPRRNGKAQPPPLMVAADEKIDLGAPGRQPPGQPQVHNNIGPVQGRKHFPFQAGQGTAGEPLHQSLGQTFKEEQPGETLS